MTNRKNREEREKWIERWAHDHRNDRHTCIYVWIPWEMHSGLPKRNFRNHGFLWKVRRLSGVFLWEDQKLIEIFFAEATNTKSEHLLKSGETKTVLNRQNCHSYKRL
jgi:hypothetical protein